VTSLLDCPAALGPPAVELFEIRRASCADGPAVQAFLAGLSIDSAYRRFFTGIGHPSPAFVRRFVEVEPGRRETVLALLGDEVVGMADWARHGDTSTIELGLVVADAWQRLGLGPRLATVVLDEAAAWGATTLVVRSLAENARIGRMLRRRWPGIPPLVEAGALVWHLPLA
jgi:GNAT superfamily N-acetyltransferase